MWLDNIREEVELKRRGVERLEDIVFCDQRLSRLLNDKSI
jgi:hypothetical protein